MRPLYNKSERNWNNRNKLEAFLFVGGGLAVRQSAASSPWCYYNTWNHCPPIISVTPTISVPR